MSRTSAPLPKLSASALQTASRTSAHADFILASINTVGTSPHIAAAISSDNFALLAEREEADRWSAVEDELRTLLEGVAASNLARRHRIGLTALQVYSIARQLTRKREHADLLPHVENMRRTNPFRSRPKEQEKKAEPAPATPPVKA